MAMFCPKCKSEYQPGYTRCSDCNTALVVELPSETNAGYGEYEEILSTNNPGDMAFLKSILDAGDIDYLLQGEHVAPYLYHAIPVRLLVRKDQVSTAIEILKDLKLSFTTFSLKDSETEDEDD